MPGWLRGSYLVRDFAKHVIELRAESAGQPLAFERTDKRSLRCTSATGPVELIYRVYAFDESVRKAWLDSRRGRSEEHTSELQSLMRISYAVFCLKKKT